MNQCLRFAACTAAMIALVMTGAFSVSAQTSADEITGCLKDRQSGKLKKFAEGDDPSKSCGNKEIEVSLPTTNKTDALMSGLSGLQAQVDEIVTSSMIGGAHNLGSNADRCETDGEVEVCTNSDCSETATVPVTECSSGPIEVDTATNFGMGMFVTRGVNLNCNPVTGVCSGEFRAQQKLTANGIITKMSVMVDQGPGEGDFSSYTLRINGQDALLFPGSNATFQCEINGEATMCTVTSSEGTPDPCVEVEMDDLIAIRILVTPVDDAEIALVTPARWNARFVENGECLLDAATE